ncbi:hypothetical protein L2E82_03350 [Cichorium intybus]|uniref:Uncharacterized protein n=1 Tax=Cichorium intybus TaxID=13427 RepID=A0ACB9H3Q7_CICIN|nr:hypothetical protein L2E82_03350 [Cichorium intybus]
METIGTFRCTKAVADGIRPNLALHAKQRTLKGTHLDQRKCPSHTMCKAFSIRERIRDTENSPNQTKSDPKESSPMFPLITSLASTLIFSNSTLHLTMIFQVPDITDAALMTHPEG